MRKPDGEPIPGSEQIAKSSTTSGLARADAHRAVLPSGVRIFALRGHLNVRDGGGREIRESRGLPDSRQRASNSSEQPAEPDGDFPFDRATLGEAFG